MILFSLNNVIQQYQYLFNSKLYLLEKRRKKKKKSNLLRLLNKYVI